MLRSQERFSESKDGGKRTEFDRRAVNAEGKVYLLALDVVKSVPAKMDWERVEVLHCIGL